MSLLTERYADKISNVLSCYDRIIIQGTVFRQNLVIVDIVDFSQPTATHSRHEGDLIFAVRLLQINVQRTTQFGP